MDTAGSLRLEYRYTNARSFSQGLAAVEVDGLWGYIDPSGKLVIEPAFLEARDFCQGSAPVLTEDGWRIIILNEYR